MSYIVPASGGSLFLTKLILEDEKFREMRIEELRKEGRLRLADELEQWGGNSELGSKVDPTFAASRKYFLERAMFSKSPKKPINSDAKRLAPSLSNLETTSVKSIGILYSFDKSKSMTFSGGKLSLIPSAIPLCPASQIATLMNWITLKTFMTAQLMEKENRGKGTFIVFNEPHQYMTPGLQKLMTRIALEGRKECLGSLFAFHHIGLLPSKLAEDLQAGGVNWFLFTNDYKKVFEMKKSELEPSFTFEEAMNIEKHYAINILNFNGRRQHAFLVHMLPPSTDRYEPYDNSFLTQRHSRMYGRHWTEVEKMTQGA